VKATRHQRADARSEAPQLRGAAARDSLRGEESHPVPEPQARRLDRHVFGGDPDGAAHASASPRTTPRTSSTW